MQSVACVGTPSFSWLPVLQRLNFVTWMSEPDQTSVDSLSSFPFVVIGSDANCEAWEKHLVCLRHYSNQVVILLDDAYLMDEEKLKGSFDRVVRAACSLDEKPRIFLSGGSSALESVTSIFSNASIESVNCGPSIRDAWLLALIQHAVCAVSRMAIIEAVGMAVKAGLPLDLVASVIRRSSGRSRQAELFFEELPAKVQVRQARWAGDIVTTLEKLVEAAMQLNQPLPLTSSAVGLLGLHRHTGAASKNIRDPFASYESLIGLQKDTALSHVGITFQQDPSAPYVIGYVGLGAMGSALALKALRVAKELHVFDPDPVKVERLTQLGARAAPDVASLADSCDFIFLCVPGEKEVEQILFGVGGMSASLAKGKVVIDQTTCSPEKTANFSARLADIGVDMIDAPVTGGPEGARNGTLVTMCGGQHEAFSRIKPILERMGGDVVYFGASGSGQSIKLVKNALGASNRLIVYEMLAFAASANVRIDTVRDALTAGVSASGALDRILNFILTGTLTADASLSTVVKDQQLISRMGRAVGSSQPMLNVVRTVLEAGSKYLGATARIDDLSRLYEIYTLKGTNNHEEA